MENLTVTFMGLQRIILTGSNPNHRVWHCNLACNLGGTSFLLSINLGWDDNGLQDGAQESFVPLQRTWVGADNPFRNLSGHDKGGVVKAVRQAARQSLRYLYDDIYDALAEYDRKANLPIEAQEMHD